jgi:hypothetical protein
VGAARESRRAQVTARLRQASALGAVGLVALGTTLMSLAQASPDADPILAESIARPSAQVNYPAPGFTLTSQYGKTVSLSSLRGKVLLLSFIDPPARDSAARPSGRSSARPLDCSAGIRSNWPGSCCPPPTALRAPCRRSTSGKA